MVTLADHEHECETVLNSVKAALAEVRLEAVLMGNTAAVISGRGGDGGLRFHVSRHSSPPRVKSFHHHE